jgi:hypothetical protein
MLTGFHCYPQITFERTGRCIVRGDTEEYYRFGKDQFAPVLFKAARRSFERFSAGKKGALHFERIQSGVIYDGCRLAPRVYTPHTIGEIARKINDQSFILRYTNEGDLRFALASLSKLDDGKDLHGWSSLRGSHTPTLCCDFDRGTTIRALMKMGLNLIAAYCESTPVDHESFAQAIRVIRGDVPVVSAMVQSMGFVHANDVQEIIGSPNEHSFRIVHIDNEWHVLSSFFGGSIGAFVRLPGPSHEDWKRIDIVAPMRSKAWKVSRSNILPVMRIHIEWRDTERMMPTVKLQQSMAIFRVEIRPRRKQKE